MRLTAKEARKKAESFVIQKNQVQYDKVMSAISNAVNDGKFEVQVFRSLAPNVKQALENDGYTINSTSDQRDGTLTLTIISW